MFVSFNSKAVGYTSEEGTAYHSKAPKFTPVFSGVRR